MGQGHFQFRRVPITQNYIYVTFKALKSKIKQGQNWPNDEAVGCCWGLMRLLLLCSKELNEALRIKSVSGVRCQVSGVRCQVPGAWCHEMYWVPGHEKYRVQYAWCNEKCLVPCSWCLVLGAWFFQEIMKIHELSWYMKSHEMPWNVMIYEKSWNAMKCHDIWESWNLMKSHEMLWNEMIWIVVKSHKMS